MKRYSRDEAQIVLQVHDELILEVVEEAAQEVAKLVKSEMENAVKLRVPIIRGCRNCAEVVVRSEVKVNRCSFESIT